MLSSTPALLRRPGRGRLAALVLLALVSPQLTTTASAQRFKLAMQAPERSFWGKAISDIETEVDKATDGAVTFRTYAGGVQGDDTTVLRKMRIGQLQGGAFIGAGVAEICPDALVLKIPFLFRSVEEARRVFAKLRPHLEEQARERGYEVLAFPELGFTYAFSRDDVRTVAKMRAAKPWLIADDKMIAQLFESLSITPVSTGVSNVTTALQSGLIETVFAPPAGLIAMQWHTRVKFLLDQRVTWSFGIIAVDGKSWKRLSPKLQTTVREIVDREIDELDETTEKRNSEAVEVLEKAGMASEPPEPESLEAFEKASTKVAESLAGDEFSKEILAQVRGWIAEFREAEDA